MPTLPALVLLLITVASGQYGYQNYQNQGYGHNRAYGYGQQNYGYGQTQSYGQYSGHSQYQGNQMYQPTARPWSFAFTHAPVMATTPTDLTANVTPSQATPIEMPETATTPGAFSSSDEDETSMNPEDDTALEDPAAEEEEAPVEDAPADENDAEAEGEMEGENEEEEQTRKKRQSFRVRYLCVRNGQQFLQNSPCGGNWNNNNRCNRRCSNHNFCRNFNRGWSCQGGCCR